MTAPKEIFRDTISNIFTVDVFNFGGFMMNRPTFSKASLDYLYDILKKEAKFVSEMTIYPEYIILTIYFPYDDVLLRFDFNYDYIEAENDI